MNHKVSTWILGVIAVIMFTTTLVIHFEDRDSPNSLRSKLTKIAEEYGLIDTSGVGGGN